MVIFLTHFLHKKQNKCFVWMFVIHMQIKKNIYTVNVLNLSLHSWAFSITADSLAQVHKQRQSQNTIRNIPKTCTEWMEMYGTERA